VVSVVGMSFSFKEKLKKKQYRSGLGIILLVDTLVIGLTMVWAVIRQKSPMRYFDETGIISWFSCIQLLVLSGLSVWIWRLRRPVTIGSDRPYLTQSSAPKINSTPKIWKWIAAGFFYLALDEVVQIHEGIDYGIHELFNLTETRLTDSIDDVILMLYGMVAGYLVYRFRAEFTHYRAVNGLIVGAIMCGLLTIGLDVYTNVDADGEIEIFAGFVPELSDRKILLDWVKAIEDAFKIWMEGFLIAAGIACVQIARSLTAQQLARRSLSSQASMDS
jgi:hypothetical protein